MSTSNQKQKICDALLRLEPRQPEIRWDRAIAIERQGHEALIAQNKEKAILKYRESLNEKRELLPYFRQNSSLWAEKRLFFVENCLHFATVLVSTERRQEARIILKEAVETAQDEQKKQIFREEFSKLLDLARDALQKIETFDEQTQRDSLSGATSR